MDEPWRYRIDLRKHAQAIVCDDHDSPIILRLYRAEVGDSLPMTSIGEAIEEHERNYHGAKGRVE